MSVLPAVNGVWHGQTEFDLTDTCYAMSFRVGILKESRSSVGT